MIFSEPGILQCGHVRFDDRELVLSALARLGVGTGVTCPVWPPRALPPGLFVSPVRNGWVSFWSMHQSSMGWLQELTEVLECRAVELGGMDDAVWFAAFYEDGHDRATVLLPLAAAERACLEELAEQEGLDATDEAVLEELRHRAEFLEMREELGELWPTGELLERFVPPHRSGVRALELLDVIAAQPAEGGVSAQVEDFAAYLGIMDATWNPRDDPEVFSRGEYGEFVEGEELPAGWKEFVVLPLAELRVM